MTPITSKALRGGNAILATLVVLGFVAGLLADDMKDSISNNADFNAHMKDSVFGDLPVLSDDEEVMLALGSDARLLRRRPGVLRRFLDPERRRRLLMLRKQGMGRRLRARLNQDYSDKVETGFTSAQRLRFFAAADPSTTTTTTTTTTTEAPKTTTFSSIFPSFTVASNLRKPKSGVRKLTSEGYGQKVKSPRLRTPKPKESSKDTTVLKTQSSTKSLLGNQHPRGRLVSKRRKLLKRPFISARNFQSTTPAPETTKTPYRLTPTPVNDHNTVDQPEVVVMTRLRPLPPVIRKSHVTNAHVIRPKQLYQLRPKPVTTVVNDVYSEDSHFFSTTSNYIESASTTSKPRIYNAELSGYEFVTPRPTAQQSSKLKAISYNREKVRSQGEYEPAKPRFRPTPKKVTYQTISPKKSLRLHQNRFPKVHSTTQKPITSSKRTIVERPHISDNYPVEDERASYYRSEDNADYIADSPYDYDESLYREESDEYDDPNIFDQYKYGYSVAAEETGTYHARSEARDGETVSGSYKVALPDGRVQIVTYIADDDGFRADVTYEGEVKEESPKPPQQRRTVASKLQKQMNYDNFSPVSLNLPAGSLHNTEKNLSQHRFKAARLNAAIPKERLIKPSPQPIQKTTQNPFGKPMERLFKPSPRTIQKTTQNPFGNKFKAQRLSASYKQNVPTKQPWYQSTPTQALIPTPAENGHPSFNFDHHLIEHSTPTPIHRPSDFQSHFPPRTSQNNPTRKSFIPRSYNIDFEPYASPTTPSPNPFRLIVEKNRASTFSPPPPPSNAPFLNYHRLSSDKTHFLANAPTPTPPINSITPSINELYEGVTQSPIPVTTPFHPFDTTPSSPDIFEYRNRFDKFTSLYRPKSDAFIHSLGQTHSVPLLLPVSKKRSTSNNQESESSIQDRIKRKFRTNPFNQPEEHDPRARTYFLSPDRRSSEGGVELRRGDETHSRLTLHIPSPHETDIYPKPRPLIPTF